MKVRRNRKPTGGYSDDVSRARVNNFEKKNQIFLINFPLVPCPSRRRHH